MNERILQSIKETVGNVKKKTIGEWKSALNNKRKPWWKRSKRVPAVEKDITRKKEKWRKKVNQM